MAEWKSLSKYPSYLVIATLIALIGSFIVYQVWVGSKMQPTFRMEGFAGPSRGAGVPDCTRTSAEGAKLISLFRDKASTTGEGTDDLRELSVLVGKLACFKRDLMGPGGVVQATFKQPFYTSHDMEAIAETAARCFAKTIPKRDLDLSFDKWNKRGVFLVKRLCTSYNFKQEEAKEALKLFDQAISDVKSIAYGACLKGDVIIAGEPGPRMLSGIEPAGLSGHMEYKGYY